MATGICLLPLNKFLRINSVRQEKLAKFRSSTTVQNLDAAMSYAQSGIVVVSSDATLSGGMTWLIRQNNISANVVVLDDIDLIVPNLRALKPNLIIFDIQSFSDWDMALRNIAAHLPAAKLLVLADDRTDFNMDRICKIEAVGCISVSEPSDMMLYVIKEILRGGVFWSGTFVRRLLKKHNAFPVDKISYDLSKREKQLLPYLARGASYKSIANTLFISTNTVATHVKSIYEKLSVRNKAEAMLVINNTILTR